MNRKNIIYQLLDLIEKASPFTPKGKPIRFDIRNDENSFFHENNDDQFIDILEKLEEENVLIIINEPERYYGLFGNYHFSLIGNYLEDPDWSCYLFKKGKNFTNYLCKIKEEINSENNDISNIIAGEDNIIYQISYSEKTREIIINNNFILSKLDFNSENEIFFNFIFKNPNQKFLMKDLKNELNGLPRKNIHTILYDLGFKGTLKKAFFSASTTAITFRNPIRKKDFEELKIPLIKLNGK